MSKHLTLEQLRTERDTLASALRAAIAPNVREFEERTGARVQAIRVGILPGLGRDPTDVESVTVDLGSI